MAGPISPFGLVLLLVVALMFVVILVSDLMRTESRDDGVSSAYTHFQHDLQQKNRQKPRHDDVIQSNIERVFDEIRPQVEKTGTSFAPPVHVHQYKFRPNLDFKRSLPHDVLTTHSEGAVKSKGVNLTCESAEVNEGEQRGHLLYWYTQTTDQCYQHYISLKYNPECGEDGVMESQYIKPLLVVAVQRSGTHFMWEMLQRLQVDVHHEGVGPDGAVSWLYAVNAHADHTPVIFEFGKGYVINNPEPLHKNRFRHIFHQVRHPLSVVSTLYHKCAEYDTFWDWIHHLRGFKQIKQDQSPLRRAMLLYLLWNKHIEQYADIRYQVESTSPRDVCLWAGFPASRCLLPYTRTSTTSTTASVGPHSNDTDASYDSHSAYSMHPHTYLPDAMEYAGRRCLAHNNTNTSADSAGVTWPDLDNEDVSLANELRVMCLEYGYALEPPLPQYKS